MDVVFETSDGRSLPVEIWFFDTVLEMKEKIQKYHSIPVDHQTLYFNQKKLEDEHDTEHYGILHNSHVQLVLKSEEPPTTTVTTATTTTTTTVAAAAATTTSTGAAAPPATLPPATGAKRVKLMVQPMSSDKKMAVEVNVFDNVSELRKEVRRVQDEHQLECPKEGYFFIYRQNVMDEDRTFRWHEVRHGDTIEMFNGSVTGGST